jgi:hypothetical protein
MSEGPSAARSPRGSLCCPLRYWLGPTRSAKARCSRAADLAASLVRLLAFDVLVSHTAKEGLVAGLLAALCGVLLALALVGRRDRRRVLADGLLLGAAGLALLYLLMQGPDARRLFLPERLAVLAPLVALLWLGTRPLSRGLRVGAAVVAAALALAQVSLHAAAYRRLEPYVADYLSAGPVVRPNTLWPELCADRVRSAGPAAVAAPGGLRAHLRPLLARARCHRPRNYHRSPATSRSAPRAGVRAALTSACARSRRAPFLDLQQRERDRGTCGSCSGGLAPPTAPTRPGPSSSGRWSGTSSGCTSRRSASCPSTGAGPPRPRDGRRGGRRGEPAAPALRRIAAAPSW